MKTILVSLGACVLAGLLWYLLSPLFIVRELQEASPMEDVSPIIDPISEKSATAEKASSPMPVGSFESRAHEVSGRALVIQKDEKQILRFENFETLNGPDLRIILSSDESDKDHIDLGHIKATKGNVNYVLPLGTDVTTYNHVLVWCRAFRVLFGVAELK